jgi:phosphatidylglycerophosphate synthase
MDNPSLKNLRDKTQKENEPEPYAKYIIRPISILFTWLFVRTPITANQVTLLQEIIGIVGSIFFIKGNFVVGALLLQLGYILDCSDGEVARWKNQQSKQGKFLDLIGHMIVIPFYYFGLGLGIYLQQGQIITIIMGFLAALFSLKIEKLLMNENGDLEIGRRGFIKSLFRYPDSMNLITVFAIVDWLFKTNLLFYLVIILGIGMTFGRLQQIYQTFKSIKN